MPTLAKPYLIPFRAEHLLCFAHRDASYDASLVSEAYEKERGPAFTAIADDNVLGCCGVSVLWPGVGYAWSMFSQELWDKWPVWATRCVRRTLRDIIRTHHLHRVEMVVLEEHRKYQKWAEALGFSPEGGVARHYTVDRKNVIRYELLTEPFVIRPLRMIDLHRFYEFLHITKQELKPWKWYIKEHETLLAEEAGKLLGYTVFGVSESQSAGYGREIVVHPDYQGRNIGARLHDARLAALRKLNLHYFVGITSDANEAMIKILTNAGAIRCNETSEGVTYVCELGAR